ncbi:hypothetical protein M758_4G099900 [Ceratodon purpureus]|nr:hypothetical protein M758_4G099900 [Ceratodon purpureus]
MAEMYLTEKMIKQQNEESLSVAGSAASSQRSSLHGDGTMGEAITTITAASSYPEVTLEDTLKHLQVTMQSPDQAPSEHLDLAVEIQPAIPREQKARHPSARDDLSPSRNEERHNQDHVCPVHHKQEHGRRSKEHQSKTSSPTREHSKVVSFHGDQKGSFQSRVGSTVSRATGASGKRPDVEELEMLLEAYFVLVDGIIHHVASVKESVDDTEDYVKIRLDDHQNTLLKVNVVLTISCLVIGIFIVVTGIFGMNITIPLFSEGTPRDFWMVVGISSAASVVLQASILGWCKYTSLF